MSLFKSNADSPRKGRPPLYETVADSLLEKISTGAIPPGSPLPSERELCLASNISRQTVRNAIRLLTLRGVVESRAGSGHFVRHPRAADRPIRPSNRATRQIGLICPPKHYLDESRQWKMLGGIQSRISREGYSLLMSVTEKDARSGFTPCWQHWLEDDEAEGYIGASVTPAIQRRLYESGRPALAMGYVWEDIPLPCIAVDFHAVYERILRHLAACGHERVGAVLTLPDTLFTSNALCGLEASVKALGWQEGQLVVKRFNDNAYDLVSAVRSLLNAPRPPTALILQGENHFDALTRYFEAEKISVPGDLHLFMTQCSPAISATWAARLGYFDFDYFHIGQKVAQRLLDLIAGHPAEPLHQEILLGKIVDVGVPAAQAALA